MNREDFGILRRDFASDYSVVDLETTGLDPKYDAIIEVAVLKVRNNEIVDSYQSLVNPQREISSFIHFLTGIDNEMVKDAPLIEPVLSKALDLIGDDIILGHNVCFDVNFLYDWSAKRLGRSVSNDRMDTRSMACRLFPGTGGGRLCDLGEYYHADVSQAHRAMADAQTAKIVYDALVKEMLAAGFDPQNYAAGSASVPSTTLKASELHPQTTNFNPDSPVYGRCFVFTGRMESMGRREGMQAVIDRGGTCADQLNTETNYLVMGDSGYSQALKDGKSAKRKKSGRMEAPREKH